jgi:uncharacterized protein (DUF2236 family)
VTHDIAWRVNAERLALLGWGRAILMQLAHPLVAAGVAEHSAFARGGRIVAVARLNQTVHAMLALVFGDPAAREATLETIRGIHRRVHGRLPQAAGRFDAGTPYSAEDPALVLWVHATLIESVPLVYDRLVAPLAAADRDAYCADAAGIALALGARDADVPRSWAALRAYMEATSASGSIAVSPQARELARRVLAPPIPVVSWPAARVNRLVTIGLLPPAIRQQYGFAWDDRAERHLERTLRWIMRVRRVTPRQLAWWPEAR